jgi:hypothetical protein
MAQSTNGLMFGGTVGFDKPHGSGNDSGVAYWDDNFDHDTSLSAGIGVGLRMGRGILDVEYTQISNYVDYITVGYSLQF